MNLPLLHKSRGEYRRKKTVERGYGADWQRLRKAKLAADPVCQIRTHCMGAIAEEVDHKIPVAVRPEGRLDWGNLQSACKSCHSAKTWRENHQ